MKVSTIESEKNGDSQDVVFVSYCTKNSNGKGENIGKRQNCARCVYY